MEELSEAKDREPVTSYSPDCGCLNIATDSLHSFVVELKYEAFCVSFIKQKKYLFKLLLVVRGKCFNNMG